jgi:hypothetical protein
MESQRKDPQVATEDREYHLENKRTLELFLLAAVIGIGFPIATLMGANAGGRTAAAAYPAHAFERDEMPRVDPGSDAIGKQN